MTVQQQPASKPRNPRGTKPATPEPEVAPIVVTVEYDSLTKNNLKYREPESDNPMFMPTLNTLYIQKPAIAMAYAGKLPVGFTVQLTPIFE